MQRPKIDRRRQPKNADFTTSIPVHALSQSATCIHYATVVSTIYTACSCHKFKPGSDNHASPWIRTQGTNQPELHHYPNLCCQDSGISVTITLGVNSTKPKVPHLYKFPALAIPGSKTIQEVSNPSRDLTCLCGTVGQNTISPNHLLALASDPGSCNLHSSMLFFAFRCWMA